MNYNAITQPIKPIKLHYRLTNDSLTDKLFVLIKSTFGYFRHKSDSLTQITGFCLDDSDLLIKYLLNGGGIRQTNQQSPNGMNSQSK